MGRPSLGRLDTLVVDAGRPGASRGLAADLGLDNARAPGRDATARARAREEASAGLTVLGQDGRAAADPERTDIVGERAVAARARLDIVGPAGPCSTDAVLIPGAPRGDHAGLDRPVGRAGQGLALAAAIVVSATLFGADAVSVAAGLLVGAPWRAQATAAVVAAGAGDAPARTDGAGIASRDIGPRWKRVVGLVCVRNVVDLVVKGRDERAAHEEERSQGNPSSHGPMVSDRASPQQYRYGARSALRMKRSGGNAMTGAEALQIVKHACQWMDKKGPNGWDGLARGAFRGAAPAAIALGLSTVACPTTTLYAGPPPVPPTQEICNDSMDNDGDGQADCADGDCATADHCRSQNAPPAAVRYGVPFPRGG